MPWKINYKKAEKVAISSYAIEEEVVYAISQTNNITVRDIVIRTTAQD